MSYPGTNPVDHNHFGNGAIASLGTPGVIIMGPSGLQVNTLGNLSGANMGDTTGPNAVNPSGVPNGIRLPSQNNFGKPRRRR
jgi:hypothetical protein